MPNESKAYSMGAEAAPVGPGNAATLHFGARSASSVNGPNQLYPGTTIGGMLFTGGTDILPQICPRAGTLKNFYLNKVPGLVATGEIYTVHVNGAPTALVITTTGPSTGGSDLVNTVPVVAGDTIGIEMVQSGAGAPSTYSSNVSACMELD